MVKRYVVRASGAMNLRWYYTNRTGGTVGAWKSEPGYPFGVRVYRSLKRALVDAKKASDCTDVTFRPVLYRG